MNNQAASKRNDMMMLRSVDRIMHIPTVEFGYNYAGEIYGRLKKSNNLIHWACDQAESSISYVVHTTMPAAAMFEGPILTIDKIVCHGLDVVEDKVPQINMPPEKLFSNGREYVNINFVKPILLRADSVKVMGSAVLDNSKYAALAADKIDDVLNVADTYVEKYLPGEASERENSDASKGEGVNTSTEKATRTIHHVDVLSRKLKRRLTRLTIAEAKVFRQHGADAISVLKTVLEVVATDPKLAVQKVKEIWGELSEDEPENQESPENLEQLLVLLTRESSRRIVHLINFADATIRKQVMVYSHRILELLDSTLKMINVDGVNSNLIDFARSRVHQLADLLHQLNVFTSDMLKDTAKNVDQKEQTVRKSPSNSSNASSISTSSSSNSNNKGGLAKNQPHHQNQSNVANQKPPASNGIDNSK